MYFGRKNNHDVNAGALSLAFWYYQKWPEPFLVHEIVRIEGRKVFWNGRNVFQIGGKKFYDQKNKIPIKIWGGEGPELE